jgi:dTDP-glucose 4,6-dehydratase
MKLFITGGAGFIGSSVVRNAIRQGHSVVNVDKLTYASNLANLAEYNDSQGYCFEHADICDGEKMRSLLGLHRPDVIMHLAAESHVDRSIDGPGDFIETNIVGTFRLLEAARHYVSNGAAPKHFRFHHISTDEVFGSLGETGAFTEDSPYQPNSPYSASKASSDMLVRAWGETYKLPVVVSNCSNNYGPFQFPEKLVPVVIMAAKEGRPIPIYGNGLNVRDWLFVDDHADALLLIAQNGVVGETYNVGGREERSNLQLVELICSLMDERFPDPAWGKHASLITFVQDRPGHDLRYAVDCSKIERELGWTPKANLAAGMAQTIDWYLANPQWLAAIAAGGHKADRLGISLKTARQ